VLRLPGMELREGDERPLFNVEIFGSLRLTGAKWIPYGEESCGFVV
jgi:hypothetical protein